jgi:putative alpha-1,2-mannosidase
MAKVGIDTSYIGVPNGTAVDCNAGYSPLGNVTGISMTHVSGTGGVPSYGLISQMPILGDLSDVNLADNTTYWQNRSMSQEEATVGSFKTVLLNGLQIELTGSKHAGLMRYTDTSSTTLCYNASTADDAELPNHASTPRDIHVLVDLTHALPGYGTQAYSQKFLYGDLHVRSDASGQPSYFGSATYKGGWSQPQSHTLHFCANFTIPTGSALVPTNAYVTQNTDGSAGAGTFSWPFDPVLPPTFSARPVPRSFNDVTAYAGSGMGIGALFSWTPINTNASAEHVVESRLGISYISAAQACENVATELLTSMSFEGVVAEARDEWEKEILSKIEIVDDGSDTSRNDTLKRMLYTALYQTGLMPSDKTGENPYWETNSSSPYYDDHYTLW